MSVYQEYKKQLKLIAVEEVFDLIFYRPVAFLFVKLIYRTTVTPNQLTIVSLVFGLLGGASFAFGTPAAFVTGSMLYLIYNIMDCSDGQLARVNHSGTPIGRLLDGFTDYAVSLSLYAGLGIGYARNAENPGFIWFLIVAAAISNAVHAGLLDFYRNRFLDVALQRRSVLVDEQKTFEHEFEALRGKRGHLFERMIIWIYLRYSALQRSMTTHDRSETPPQTVSPELFVKSNRVLMHLWTYLGPTTTWTFLIVCTFLNRLDIYLWGIVVVGNTLALVLYALQRRTDLALRKKSLQ